MTGETQRWPRQRASGIIGAMRLVDLSPRSGFALLALGALGAGCSDGISAPRDTQSDDAGAAAERDSAAQPVAEGGAIYWPDSGALPEEVLALLEAGALDPKRDGEVLYPCLTRLSSNSFALDASNCATRPAEPCTAADPARAKWLVEPSDFIADECGSWRNFPAPACVAYAPTRFERGSRLFWA